MCEHFVAAAAEPFRIDELWPFAERLERFGIAGFGWGAGWLDAEDGLRTHRDTIAFRDDPAREDIGAHETTALLVHLRRPSKLSTIGLADAQPFPDPAGRFVFSHNGDFADWQGRRRTYRDQGRIEGRADTEVAARWLEDEWTSPAAAPQALSCLHDTFRGQANLAVLAANGSLHAYAGNSENPVFAFRLGRISIVATGIYSIDRSLFRFVAPNATERRLVKPGSTITLDGGGRR